ncbi:MAG: zinc-ribbon domain-containing protein [Phototrophicaceae bacterium]
MFILLGTRNRITKMEEGKFHCPNCKAERAYHRNRVRQWFTAYFIPIFPIAAPQEFIECQTCHMAFLPDALTTPAKFKRDVRPLAEQLNTLQARLEGGLSLEYALADLTAAGLDRAVALENVRRVIGEESTWQTCPTCHLTYANTLAACPDDNTMLRAKAL